MEVVSVVETVMVSAVDAGQAAGHMVKKFNPVSVLIRLVLRKTLLFWL